MNAEILMYSLDSRNRGFRTKAKYQETCDKNFKSWQTSFQLS